MDLDGRDFLVFEKVDKVFIDRQYRRVAALEEISFSVNAGEFLSIVGPSGCGKSTILRIAAGLDHPTKGKVTMEGQDIEGPGRQRGLVFQSYNAFPWLTVRENIAFGLQKASGSAEKVSKWLEDLGLMEFAGYYPKVLSGGMRQRLALARSMIVEPRLLLLDEPVGALDERTREAMQQLLLSITSRNGCTVLFVTHDGRESVLLSNRVLVLSPRPGRVRSTIVSTLNQPRSRELYGTPEFELLYARITDRWEPEQPLAPLEGRR